MSALITPIISVNPSKALRARVFAEEVLGSTTVCLHAIVLNIENSFQSINASIAFAGLPASVVASLPFEDDGDRTVIVSGGRLEDLVAPSSVNVYRIGCNVRMPRRLNPPPKHPRSRHRRWKICMRSAGFPR